MVLKIHRYLLLSFFRSAHVNDVCLPQLSFTPTPCLIATFSVMLTLLGASVCFGGRFVLQRKLIVLAPPFQRRIAEMPPPHPPPHQH